MIAGGLLRAAGRLYPRRVRDELFEDMLIVFDRERSRIRGGKGRLAAARFSLRTVLSALGQGLRTRFGRQRFDGVHGPALPGGGGLGHDLRHAVAALRAAPGYVGVAVITLGLGVGISAALWIVVDGVLLKPLPYPEAERLVRVWRTLPQFDWRRAPVSLPTFRDWADQASSFDTIGVRSGGSPMIWLGGEYPQRVVVAYVDDGLLDMLEVRPLRGRLPEAAEANLQAPPALLSESFWRNELGADPGVLGRSLELQGLRPVVVGVLPAGALLSEGADLWLPAPLAPQAADRTANFVQAVARLAPGVTLAEAQAEMEAISARLAEAYPEAANGSGVWLEPHRDYLLGAVRPLLRLLGGSALLVLVIVCASLSGLALTRVHARSNELAVRGALGATAGRVARQLLTESLLLGTAGAALGAWIAHQLLTLLLAYGPDDLPRRSEIAFDGDALVLVVAVSLCSAWVVGLLPALRATCLAAFRGGLPAGQTGAVGAGLGGHRALRALAAAQVALSTVLLIGAALLGHSFLRLAAVDPGFETEGRLSAQVALPEERYPDSPSARVFFDTLLERIEAIPGVRSAGAAWALPFRPTYGSSNYVVEGQPAPEGIEPLIGLVPVAGDYFRAMGVPVLHGRAFTAEDREGAPPAAVVNETMALRHWPDGEAVGQQFIRGETAYTIVGVVPDVKRQSLAEEVMAEAYLPFSQISWANDLYVVLHGDGDEAVLARELRETLHDLDPALPATGVASISDLLGKTLTAPRFRAILIGGFAVFAALLALLGVYGVVRLTVTSRTAEIGLRIALGAGRVRTQRRVVASGVRIAGAGILLGVPGAWAVAGTVESLVFGITPTDPMTYVAVALGLVAVVALASWLPARWASRIDPAIALRR